MILYSYNNGPARELPFRIRMPDGSTRTGGDFSAEDLAEAGYFGPLPEAPSHDPATEAAPRWDGSQWVVDALSAEVIAAKVR